MKKILVITYYWPPSGGAGVQRILKFVKYFPKFGIFPYVVTVKEDKASYPVFDKTLSKDVPAQAKIFRTDTFEPFGVYSKILGKKSIPLQVFSCFATLNPHFANSIFAHFLLYCIVRKRTQTAKCRATESS